MPRRKTHPEVEFVVSALTDHEFYTGDYNQAAINAMVTAIGTGESTLDVLIYGERGAAWWGGDDAVEQYREDPEASVFERFEIKVNPVGRIP